MTTSQSASLADQLRPDSVASRIKVQARRGASTFKAWRPSRHWRCWIALFPLFFTACATVQRIDDGAADAFSRTGRFALTVQSPDAPPQATQGGFSWNDDGRILRIHLSNPLGSVLAQLRVQADRAVLMRSDGTQAQAQDPDALAARVLGRAVPVSSLRAWLRGQVQPSVAHVQRDDAGRVVAFTQDGWQVQTSRFDAQGPRLLRLSRHDAGERLQLRLVIDSE